MKDIIIIGGGPAGLSAAIYAGRAELDTIIIEKSYQGGQIINTNEVENYPGILDISGPDLAMRMFEHVQKFNVPIEYEEVVSIVVEGNVKKVITDKHTYDTKTIILAMGAKPNYLQLDNEKNFWGKGISYCAICDAAFYRGKVVAVVGGGDTAIEDALYLDRMAEKVYIICRKNQLRGAKSLQNRLSQSSVEILWNTQVTALLGDDLLSGVTLYNTTTQESNDLTLSGLFVAIGSSASTELVNGLVETDAQGYILAGENCETNIPGVFAVGDIRQKQLRQVITAVADGGVSIYQAEKYISENF